MKDMEHGGQIWRWMKEYGFKQDEIIDFSANINPLGPPKELVDTLRDEFWNLRHYPESNGYSVKQEIAEHHQVGCEQVIIGNGASELLDLLAIKERLRVSEDDADSSYQEPRGGSFTAFSRAPTFSEYKRSVQAVEGSYFSWSVLNLSQNYGEFIKQITELCPEMVFICSPDNPTGEMFDSDMLKQIQGVVNELGSTLLIDHSFLPFADKNWSYRARDLLDEHTVLLYSFTKMYSLPGLRLGYALASRECTAKLESLRNQWSVNHLAQTAIKKCLHMAEFEERTRALIEEEKVKLMTELSNLGFNTFYGAANYILVRNEQYPLSTEKLWESLSARGLFIRLCGNFKGLDKDYLRIAVRLPEENNYLIDQLKTLWYYGSDGREEV